MMRRRGENEHCVPVGVGELAGLLARAPHPDELAAAVELSGRGSLSVGGVVAGALVFGDGAVARDQPGAHGRDFVVGSLAGLLEVLGVDPSLVVAVQVSPGVGVRLGLAWPAPPPPGFVAVSDLVWALHPGLSAGRLAQLGEGTDSSRVRWVPIGAELAVNLAGAPHVSVAAGDADRLEEMVGQLSAAADVEVVVQVAAWTLRAGDCHSVWQVDGRGGPGSVVVVSTPLGWRIDPWGFATIPLRSRAAGSVSIARDEEAAVDTGACDPGGADEPAGGGRVAVPLVSSTTGSVFDGEGWWEAPVLELV